MLKRHLTFVMCGVLTLAISSPSTATATEKGALTHRHAQTLTSERGLSVGHKLSRPLRSSGGAGIAVAFLRSLDRCDRRGNCKHARRMNPGEAATARAAARDQVRK